MDCIFCKIVEGTVPAKKVYENEHVLAFRDIEPIAPVHILIIPKKHIESMNAVDGDDWGLIAEIHRAAQHIAKQEGVAESGYRLVNNCGRDAGQAVYHIHYHLLAGEKLGWAKTN
ncbi:histidine triad nucleotide-binding protein [Paenibacillus xerothermodurans]|uniref:Histidine triad nucleotide-binding protein n=1 Tax=Paenibacillus xerothermodurans TaxID=1977292 RepID=A0A2W1NT69_PAEXE|nr:histidine triad nucleotide-binding protein [Paenibacillus xerothermodurans]PZE22705.1 histidine triad nucleotide-binding protein [Paenibacillus xerothermodurans]